MDMIEICRGAGLGSATVSDLCSIFGTVSSTYLSISTFEDSRDGRGRYGYKVQQLLGVVEVQRITSHN